MQAAGVPPDLLERARLGAVLWDLAPTREG